MPHHAVAIVLALVCASLCAQSTWIVDDDGGAGVHFTSLPAAVAAAANGDTLLVAPGHYEPFHVTGKALTIRGDGPATTFVDGSQGAALADYVSIANPPVGAVFRLSGLRLRHPLPAFTIAYRARLALLGGGVATSGSVVVHDVVAEGVTGLGWFGGLGLRVEGIVAHVARCQFRAMEWYQGNTAIGYPGGWVRGGAVLVADDCTFRGGDATTSWVMNASGGSGLHVDAAAALLTRCECRGGSSPAMTGYSLGGHGLLALNGALVQVHGSSQHALVGGSAGPAGSTTSGIGLVVQAPSAAEVFGAVTTATTTPTGLVSPSVGGTGAVATGLPARPQLSLTGTATAGASLAAAQNVTARIDSGLPNELFALLLDDGPALSPAVPLALEPVLLATPTIATFGLLDAAGSWNVTFVPALHAPWLVGVPLHLQAFVVDSGANGWRGSNAVVHRIGP